MAHLNQAIAARVDEWRAGGYRTEGYSAIAEILGFARLPDHNTPHYLRHPQLRALETYWYLRLVENTPRVFELYRRFFPRQTELLAALGLDRSEIKDLVLDQGLEALWNRIKTDDVFVRGLKLETLRETLELAYPSYILALAMGAGKTILIGAIVATEFAMAQEYPGQGFVENALVFAPGKTIIESLRELSQIPYDRLLPPRLYRSFAASVKLTFTRDGEKDVPVIRGSSYNVVVTNTEKIRIQKETIRKSDLVGLFAGSRQDEARAEIANLRLQAIASLPHLAVFSDEAHHTYGQSLDSDLKKVRKTVNFLAASTNVVCVVNTTGTPYFERQPLRDVVIWYGLSEGIRDGILKDLAGSIQAFDFSGDARAYLTHVIKDFFTDYGEVRLPSGAPAKLAVYFPQTDDLRELRPTIDQALVEVGQSPVVCLVNTSDTTLTKSADIDAFNRLNDPGAPHRVVLLVNKGTEGWNCPSLFACALARRLKTSNNFVLQAATRCLRQVPGNALKARVYLSVDNFGILDRQLQETYGEGIAELNRAGQETRRSQLLLRKVAIPPLVLTRTVRTVRPKPVDRPPLKLQRPSVAPAPDLTKTTFTVAERHATLSILQEVEGAVTVEAEPRVTDAYAAGVDLAGSYRLDLWEVYDEIRRLYGREDIPMAHLADLAGQIEGQVCAYEVTEEQVEVALALVKPQGFARTTDLSGTEVYTAEIVYPKDRERLLLRWSDLERENPRDFGFHYTPYNFDSGPEKSFFEQLLYHMNLKPDEVEDIYFTGALTDPGKTDFFIEYRDDQGKWRRYTPDFVIRRKPLADQPAGTGRLFIVEVKAEHQRSHGVDGENGTKALALRRWVDLNPDRLRYQMVFTPGATVTADQFKDARQFVEEVGS